MRIPWVCNAVAFVLVSHCLRAALCFSKVPTHLVSHDEDDGDSQRMLAGEQQNAPSSDANFTPQTQDDINPIYYLHVPQSGSGFATTVAHHACKNDIPDDLSIVEPHDFFRAWTSKCDHSKFTRFRSGHDPLLKDADLAHVVVMMREPLQRILSGYYDGLHDCWSMRKKYNCSTSTSVRCEGDLEGPDGSPIRDPQSIPPAEYGRCVRNCAAHMLTGKSCDDASDANVDRAVEVVNKLGFVGLTDEWALSVCLWHKRFGGRMLPAEFKHASLGAVSAITGGTSKYDAHALLGRWRPRGDTRVFEAATNRFWKDIWAHGVTKKECEKDMNLLIAQTLPNGQDRTDLFPNINPIYYLHFPSSGSGFATTLAHYACDLPDHVAVRDPGEFARSWPTCDHSRFQRFRSGIDPLDMGSVSGLKHVVMMVRDPSQRILSGYYSGLQDCWSLRKKYHCETENETGITRCDGDTQMADGTFLRNPSIISPAEYGNCVQNCTANMLTGRSCDEAGEVDLKKAIRRVEKAGFVGLADEWELSVCLWHRRFGGRMLTAELANVRPGVFTAATGGASRYDKHVLLGSWWPQTEALVYEAAANRFWEEVYQYNMSRENCEAEAAALIRNASNVVVPDTSVEIRGDLDINPIYYLRVPESGAGLATMVAHHACKGKLSENLAVGEPDDFLGSWEHVCSRFQFKRFESSFAPLDLRERESIEHVVMMAREPFQRILSGYYNGLKGCERLQNIEDTPGILPIEYADCVGNCSANLLTGRQCDERGDVDVQRAVAMVDLIGFVGLEHEWELSVCLWHKRFGGKVLPAEMKDVRSQISLPGTNTAEYNEALLGHWRPAADREVFEAASRRFWREIERFGVSRETCAEEMYTPSRQEDEATVKDTIIDFGWKFDINPIYYLHIPGTGSGFATTLAHHACGEKLPKDAAILEPSYLYEASTCDPSRFGRFSSGYDPVERDADLSHVVVMLREPSQRALSGYFNDLHDCPEIRSKYNCYESEGSYLCDGDETDEKGRIIRNPRVIPPLEYATCVENCMANMLTGHSCSERGSVDVAEAVSAVGKLGFVGISEEWALSICLWHKRFGGGMLPAELERLRAGALRGVMDGNGKYSARGLLGQWNSSADTRVYEAAVTRFWREIERYEVDQESCLRQANKLVKNMKPARVVGVSSMTINPIYYLHVPGAGSGLATTIAHHACSGSIPDNLAVIEPSVFLKQWERHCNSSRFARFQSGHDALDALSADFAHVVVMIRDPSKRILSGYFNDLHDCPALQRKYACTRFNGAFRCNGDTLSKGGRFMRDITAIPPKEYGSCVENCTANMLTGRSCSDPGDVDVAQAVAVIERLGFVGLTDEWALSLCLWHRMFGGRMVPAELKNVRPGAMTARTHGLGTYDSHTLLGSWSPSADSRVFEAASRRFWSDIDRFGVTHETCEEEINPLIGQVSSVEVVGSL